MNILEFEVDQLLSEKQQLELDDTIYSLELNNHSANLVVAGGCIRKIFEGNFKQAFCSDIDYFKVQSGDSQKDLIQVQLEALGPDELTEPLTEEFVERRLNFQTERDGVKHQFITKAYEGISELFDSFDFTLCQFAYDGKKFYTTQEALLSVASGKISISTITYPVASLRRLYKYMTYGYFACDGTMRDFLIAAAEYKGRTELMEVFYID